MATYTEQLEAKIKALEKVLNSQRQEIIDLKVQIEIMKRDSDEGVLKEDLEETPKYSSYENLKISAINTWISQVNSCWGDSNRLVCAKNIFKIAIEAESEKVKIYAIDAIDKINGVCFGSAAKNECLKLINDLAC